MAFYELHEYDSILRLRVFAHAAPNDPIIITKSYISLHIIIEQNVVAHIIDRAYERDQQVTIHMSVDSKLCYYMDGFIDRTCTFNRSINAFIESRASLGLMSSVLCAGTFYLDCTIFLKGIKAQFFAGSMVMLLQQGFYKQSLVKKHICQDTVSESRLYGIVETEGFLEHNGLIIIEPIAKQSSAQFVTKALPLGPDAKISAKPMLEIAPKSVFVRHGVAIGPLDKQQVIFLQSRGIMPAQAALLLKKAFLAQMHSNLPLWLITEGLTYFRLPI